MKFEVAGSDAMVVGATGEALYSVLIAAGEHCNAGALNGDGSTAMFSLAEGGAGGGPLLGLGVINADADEGVTPPCL